MKKMAFKLKICLLLITLVAFFGVDGRVFNPVSIKRFQDMESFNKMNDDALNTNKEVLRFRREGIPSDFEEDCIAVYPALESEILLSEPRKFTQKLEKWLPKKGNWKICWRAPRDGWKSSTFHSRCDGKSPTLTVVKVVKNNKAYIFGGYVTKPWATDGKWTSAPGSFVFSLRNNDDLPPFKATLKDENDGTVIYRSPSYGPAVGSAFWIHGNAVSNAYIYSNFGDDFKLPSGYTYKETKTKSLLAGSDHSTPSQVEVLYLD